MAKWFSRGGEAHRGRYRGIWCDSSWELAFVLWCIDHGKEIVRNTRDFPYVYRRRRRMYRPDFVVDGEYVEVKGVMDGRSRRKITSFPYPLKVLGAAGMEPILKYARDTYGEDFWRLLQSGV